MCVSVQATNSTSLPLKLRQTGSRFFLLLVDNLLIHDFSPNYFHVILLITSIRVQGTAIFCSFYWLRFLRPSIILTDIIQTKFPHNCTNCGPSRTIQFCLFELFNLFKTIVSCQQQSIQYDRHTDKDTTTSGQLTRLRLQWRLVSGVVNDDCNYSALEICERSGGEARRMIIFGYGLVV